ADGRTTREIATSLAYSEGTIKEALHTLISRLHLRKRTHAVAFAVREGLIRPSTRSTRCAGTAPPAHQPTPPTRRPRRSSPATPNRLEPAVQGADPLRRPRRPAPPRPHPCPGHDHTRDMRRKRYDRR